MQHSALSPTRRNCGLPVAERGISLIELMIAMTLGLLVIGAMTTIFINNSQSRRELDKAAQQLENGRYAIQILRDELSLAGYYDSLAKLDISPASTSAKPCAESLADWKKSLDAAVEGINSGSFSCITTARANTGMLFVQRASTAITPLDNLTPGVAYMQISLCGEDYTTSVDTRYKLENAAAGVFTLKEIDCAATLAPVRQYIRRIFFIDQNNVAGDGIPTLKRVDFGAGQKIGTPVALVEGIEDLHFEYALDESGDGSPDIYTESPNPLLGTPPTNQLVNIVGIRVWLIARAIERTAGYSDTKAYKLGGKADYKPADDFKRHVYSTYIELTHPVARRAK